MANVMFAHYFGGKKPFLIVNNDWALPAEDEKKFFAMNPEYPAGSEGYGTAGAGILS